MTLKSERLPNEYIDIPDFLLSVDEDIPDIDEQRWEVVEDTLCSMLGLHKENNGAF